MAGDGITPNSSTSLVGSTPASSRHSRRAASDQRLVLLDPSSRHLHQIALARRKVRTDAKLAHQHNLVARQVDGNDCHHLADAHDVALVHARIAVRQRHPKPFVGPITLRQQLRAFDLRGDSAVGQFVLAHWATTPSGAVSRLNAAANSARV